MKNLFFLAGVLLCFALPAQLFDTSFAHTGISSPAGMSGGVNHLVIQPDQKIVAAYDHWHDQPAARSYLLAARLHTNGQADTNFGSGGTAQIWIGPGASALDASLQADGKVIVSGQADYCVYLVCGFPNLGVARFDSTGQVDSTFGLNGLVRSDDLFDTMHIMGASACRVFVLPTGKILIGGFCYTNQPSSSSKYVYVARLNSNGSLDMSFGQNGFFKTGPAGYYEFGDMTLDAAGNIYVSGGMYNGNYFYDTYVYKLNASGQIQTSFGTNGVAHFFYPQHFPWVKTVRVRNDGKVIVGGYYSDSLYTVLTGYIAMFEANGSLSNEIPGGQRIFSYPAWDNVYINAIQVLGDGHILYTGRLDSSSAYTSNVIAGRLNHDGSDDPSFTGTSGDTIFNTGVYSTFGSGTYSNCLLQQSDGKILVGGSYNTAAQSSWQAFAVFRLTPDSIMTGSREIIRDENSLSVYPVPSAGKSTIVLPKGKSVASLSVRDISGKIILQKNIPPGSAEIQIDLSANENGVYFTEALDENGNPIALAKIVKAD